MSGFPVTKSVQFMSRVGIKERPYTINAEITNRDSLRLETGYGQLFLNRAGVECLFNLLRDSLSIMGDDAAPDDPDASDAPDAQKPDAKQKRKRS